ncbi:SGNH/GDSL hydrolase family protein [Daejeonella lutea]|uniref:Lysophospholipase L1 n=1 Tax=Daejeonella lutea TaxID=572036 RepID=A0A1T5DY35_9SPHI|nr:SGNH/GDSL hydrolase family protein [Daejeonella lutea]SKB76460.1 Lysophospholipase L1 [Daejeonella lutea]
MKFIIGLFLVFSVSACKKNLVNGGSGDGHPETKTFLALGDSYTSGEGVIQSESFPFQLAAKLRASGVKMETPHVIARTGWTTVNLLAALKEEPMDDKYDFVTVLIGVNNQYVKRSLTEYRTHFVEILNSAISHSRGGRATVYVISIPDWSVTPFGKLKDTKLESASVDVYNDVNREESKNASVNYIDITAASRIADTDDSYTSIDGLHPSYKMYKEWADKLYPLVKKELN